MSGATPTTTKLAADIKVGDRICYKSGQVQDWKRNGYQNSYTHLSGDVMSIEITDEGKLRFLTSSSWLTPVLGDVEFAIVPSDYQGVTRQRQYDVRQPEVVGGRSIE